MILNGLFLFKIAVILLVRMWVEIIFQSHLIFYRKVILLVRMWVEILEADGVDKWFEGHPPREDVSWNSHLHMSPFCSKVILLVRMWVEIWKNTTFLCRKKRHPPREDVSWNVMDMNQRTIWLWSSSSWGCELKWGLFFFLFCFLMSSSSWGCELKSPADIQK